MPEAYSHRVRRSTTADTLRAQNVVTPSSFDRITTQHTLTELQKVLLRRLNQELADPATDRAVCDVIAGGNGLSLRQLDWLVTNYAKQNCVRTRHADGSLSLLYDEYRATLAAYRRRNFDPFRRVVRRDAHGDTFDCSIWYRSHNGAVLRTSIGQLNFAVWAQRCGALEYGRENATEVAQNMRRTSARARVLRKQSKARLTLSAQPPNKCRAYSCKRTVRIR